MSSADLAILFVYYGSLCTLALFGIHRLYLVYLHGRVAFASPLPPAPDPWPSVTIQLPLYNEPHVAERLIEAVSEIRYQGELTIQVLDDSTDDTSTIVERIVEEQKRRGVRIEHIRRASRTGFKAGALAHGLEKSGSELFAIFDADFVPAPDILQRMVPHFTDAQIGMVQARWGHLNRTESVLTSVQAIYLDGHFAIESDARHRSGRYFNFNGTAGIWRREAIVEAGGWSSSTLTEDLDLSYRAQLAGWSFVFVPGIEVPAELPASLSGFEEQQHRWAKGSIQTARKILVGLLRSDIPLRVKIEACFHLTNNSAYLLTLMIALLLVPAILIRQRLGLSWTVAIDALFFFMSTFSVVAFYIVGQRCLGHGAIRPQVFFSLLPIGIAISIRNAAAVLEGLFERGGEFHRTLKLGDSGTPSHESAPRIPLAEIIVATYFWAAFITLAMNRQFVSLPFVLLFLAGFSYAAMWGSIERFRFFWNRSTSAGNA